MIAQDECDGPVNIVLSLEGVSQDSRWLLWLVHNIAKSTDKRCPPAPVSSFHTNNCTNVLGTTPGRLKRPDTPCGCTLATIQANTIFQIDSRLKTGSQDYLSRMRHSSIFQTHMQFIVLNRNSGSACPLSEYSYSVEAHTASWMTQGNGNEEVSNALLKSLVRISCSLPDRTGFSGQPRTEQINQCHFPL